MKSGRSKKLMKIAARAREFRDSGLFSLRVAVQRCTSEQARSGLATSNSPIMHSLVSERWEPNPSKEELIAIAWLGVRVQGLAANQGSSLMSCRDYFGVI